MIENVDYFVRVVQFPNGANRGAVYMNEDGTYDVYLNSMYTDLTKGYEHEVRHLFLDHFHAEEKPIKQIEAEADGKPKKKSAEDGTKTITLYSSLEAFTREMAKKHGKIMGVTA